MKPAPYQEALDAYANPFHEFIVEPITAGLINQSYKATSKHSGESFFLQQINPHIFSDPENVQLNYEMLWKHLQAGSGHFAIPEPKYFVGDTTLFCDSLSNYWRVFEFIYGAQTLYTAENTTQAGAVAKTFANFTASFENFDIDRLHIVIPDFHNLSFRYKQFKQSFHSHYYERLQKASSLIDELKRRDRYDNFYDVMTESEEFPLRVMHHDAKISNVLFDEDTGKVICPIDYDTVMSGYFFSDLGDMIRSMACCENENSINFDDICIRKGFYEAIVAGYLAVLGKQLTAAEKKYIHYAGLLMTYMQALRFLTDYLDGDIYYKISYPEQNFDRAKNQLVLLEKLEDFLKEEYKFSV